MFMDSKKIRISCCGDSITFGWCATDMKYSYPSVLQMLLCDDFIVGNYGKSGATVIDDYEFVPDRYSPYVKSAEYNDALCSKPDVVILMLGMNDANPTHHFNSENGGSMSESYLEYYRQKLENMIEKFKSLETSPRVYLATTAMKRVAGEWYSQKYVDDFTNNLVKIREIQASIAREKKLILIDTLSQMQEDSFYSDGCHLTDKGYHNLALVIKESL